MNELALFAGIHGIGLGLKRAFERRGLPFRTVCYIEWDDYCVEVLKSRIRDGMLDDAPIWGDITTFDGRPWAGCVDIITGGFPCQDLSFAGKGAGLEGERSGLFFELMRVVREVRPPFVLLEIVPALLIRGFGRVAAEMAASGYDLQWDCIPAAAVGAPHRRDRVFILAYAAKLLSNGCHDNPGIGTQGKQISQFRNGYGTEDLADAIGNRLEGPIQNKYRAGTPRGIFTGGEITRTGSQRFVSGRMGRNYRNGCWAAEPDVGRLANGIPHQLDRIRVLGNAVVPQVAEYVGERLIDWLYGSENG